MNKPLQFSLISENEEKEKYKINTQKDINLNLISLPQSWLKWYPVSNSTLFIQPNIGKRHISVDLYLEIDSF